jgi:hypothetical protein
VERLIRSVERGGPEVVGPPVRGVAVLTQDVGGLFPREDGRLARRRRQATAQRLARRALSLATEVHGVVEDRPGAEQAWQRSVAAVAERHDREPEDTDECVRALARVASLALGLPELPDDQWQAEMIAFADEAQLIELREACLDLAAAALALADA